MAFNSEMQQRPNGPWSDDFIKRVSRIRDASGMSLKALGEKLGFSGPFTHGLLNGKEGHHMASKHCVRVLKAVQEMELEAGFGKSADVHNSAELTLEQLIKCIHAHGFSVELKPL